MKPREAVLLAVALSILTSLVCFEFSGSAVPLYTFMVFGTALWAALDSSKVQLQRYRSGIAHGPIVLFFGILLLWIVVFPWYLTIRYKIKTGTAVLRDGATNVAA
jgi:hypothetical protein